MVHKKWRNRVVLCDGISEGEGIGATKELEMVALTEDLPDHGLVSGDIGTVVLLHKNGEEFDVEFATIAGETIAVVTLFASQIRPINLSEIAHARSVAV